MRATEALDEKRQYISEMRRDRGQVTMEGLGTHQPWLKNYTLQIWLARSQGQSGHHPLRNFRRGAVATVTWPPKFTWRIYALSKRLLGLVWIIAKPISRDDRASVHLLLVLLLFPTSYWESGEPYLTHQAYYLEAAATACSCQIFEMFAEQVDTPTLSNTDDLPIISTTDVINVRKKTKNVKNALFIPKK